MNSADSNYKLKWYEDRDLKDDTDARMRLEADSKEKKPLPKIAHPTKFFCQSSSKTFEVLELFSIGFLTQLEAA